VKVDVGAVAPIRVRVAQDPYSAGGGASVKLTSIVSGPDGRYAAIGGAWVQVGERVGDWRVAAMDDDRVHLRSARGELMLGMDGSIKFVRAQHHSKSVSRGGK